MVQNANANAVLVIAAYPSSASLSREMRRRGSTAQLMNVSFVGTSALRASLQSHEASGIGVAQVVPFPWNERVPVVKEYQKLMRRQQAKPQFGFISLEGFLAAKMTVEGLRRAGPAPTRQRRRMDHLRLRHAPGRIAARSRSDPPRRRTPPPARAHDPV
jgi:ABC-type branched-subunit amino acid transport system substrate-binding protein